MTIIQDKIKIDVYTLPTLFANTINKIENIKKL